MSYFFFSFTDGLVLSSSLSTLFKTPQQNYRNAVDFNMWHDFTKFYLVLILKTNLLVRLVIFFIIFDKSLFLFIHSCRVKYMSIIMITFWRCPWCSRYRRRKWTRRHEFKSWTILIAFHIALIPLGKV